MRISDWSSDVCSSDLRTLKLPFSQGELHELPTVIPAPRFATYLQAMGNDREKALALYAWHLDLSSALIVPLQVCDVAVRNGLAEAIEHVHGANWPWHNGFIRSLPRPKSQFRYNPANDLQSCAASDRKTTRLNSSH